MRIHKDTSDKDYEEEVKKARELRYSKSKNVDEAYSLSASFGEREFF